MRFDLFLINKVLAASLFAANYPISDDQAVTTIIKESIQDYRGPCPCPFFFDSQGRLCGRRSAWSRDGGLDPKCYKSDISEKELLREKIKLFNNESVLTSKN